MRTLIIFLSLYTFVPFHFNAQDVFINEIMASNSNVISDEDGDYEDWIEIVNNGSASVNLEDYGLTDDLSQPFQWIFPAITLLPGEFILVWASGKDKTDPNEVLHTNFSISSSGEEIQLTDANGNVIDQIPSVAIPTNISYGREQDGSSNWLFFSSGNTSPGFSNNNMSGVPQLTTPPIFSNTTGFYSSDFVLDLSHPDPTAEIYYTIDGSWPDENNLNGETYFYKNQYPELPGQTQGILLQDSISTKVYENPIPIEDYENKPNDLAMKSSTWHFLPDYLPQFNLKKSTVVRAKAVVNGLSSETITHCYFVSANNSFDHDLPILSVNIDKSDLFDYNNGIYTAGQDFDIWRNSFPNTPVNGHRPANYRRAGLPTEKIANITYIDNGQTVLSQNVGVRIHGGVSRARRNKTLRIYARAVYDMNNTLDYPFFGTGNDNSFKRLITRNSGNDAYMTFFRDALMQKTLKHMKFDVQDYQPIVTYLNGEYWGMANIRERYDKHYIKRYYGIDENELDFLDRNADVKEGSNTHFLNMRSFISSNDMSDNANFNQVQELMDVENYADYVIGNIFVRNTDWPGNNIRYFRKQTAQYEPSAPYGHDGRWRWLMFDTDHGFGYAGHPNSYMHNTLAFATTTNGPGWPNPPWSTVITRELLKNIDYRNYFVNRFADMLNTAFLPQRTLNLMDSISQLYSNEISYHSDRWNVMEDWEDQIEIIEEFLLERPFYQWQHILSYFQLDGTFTIDIDVSDASHGFVEVNTIEIHPSTVGVPNQPYPWNGDYFQNIPIQLKAIPEPGYTFSHWSGDYAGTDAEITIDSDTNVQIVAHFEPFISEDHDLMYYWVFDSSLPNNTPLESLTNSYSSTGEIAQINFVSCLPDYPYDPNHAYWRVASMERRNAPTSINYRPTGNNNIAYQDADLRGLQVKQYFEWNGQENEILLEVPTILHKEILLSFAAKEEGVADQFQVEYWFDTAMEWTSLNLSQSIFQLADTFQLYEIDFSNIALANHHPNFLVRVTFDGPNLSLNDGDRVTFNNIAVEGIFDPTLATMKEMDLNVSVLPNPTSDYVTIQSDALFDQVQLYDLSGRRLSNVALAPTYTHKTDLSQATPGIYILKVGAGKASKSIKIVKY